MERLHKAALLAAFARKLSEKGSWCGETHLQKSTYFFQTLFGNPTGYEFILYKHGPFSFDLRDALSAMRADGLLDLCPQPYPFGPRLEPTELSNMLWDRFQQTLGRYDSALDFLADKLGDKGVAELERLAMALYVTREGEVGDSIDGRAQRISELKPHVAIEQAKRAVETVDKIIAESRTLAQTG